MCNDGAFHVWGKQIMKLKTLVSVFVLVAALVGMTFAAPAQAAQASGVCSQYHTVQPGENLFRIGLRYGLTVTTLQSMNGLVNPNWIWAGQSLCVQVQSTPRTYVVQPGDWLAKIARQFGVNMTVLAQVNHLWNPNTIYAGQVLVIPDFTIQ